MLFDFHIYIYIYAGFHARFLSFAALTATNHMCRRNDEPTWYKQKAKALFISDLAALQSTLAIKGSSGLKPCLWCQNILKKDSGLSDDRFRDISEHDVSRFEMASDATIWACCDHIAERIPHLNAKMREQMEKSYLKAGSYLDYLK